MRFIRLGLSAAAVSSLLAAPVALSAQIIRPDPCFECRIRDNVDRQIERQRLARERAEDRVHIRAFDAQDRTRRLEDARLQRELSSQLRAEARELTRRDQIRDNQERSRLRIEESRLRALDRAAEARQRARDRIRFGPPGIRWME